MYFKIMFIISGVICTSAKRSHKLCLTYGCFDLSKTQVCMTLDGDDLYYVDYTKEELVYDSRIPLAAHVSETYQCAVYYRSLCKCELAEWKQDKSTSSPNREPPEVIIYPRDQVVQEEENTLICFINHFFPPTINIKWSKNDKEITVDNPFKKCLPNPDGTFHVLSALDFVPLEGDIYGCTVEHEALEDPLTRFWEVDANTVKTTMDSTIYFGFASVFGILGVAAGIFFFVKGKHA